MPVKCPRCKSRNVHHSRVRSWTERLRRRVTGRVPFRCHDCQWRGWRGDSAPPGRSGSLREIHRELTDSELERLDPDQR